MAGIQCRYYPASSSKMFGATPPPQNELTPFYPRSSTQGWLGKSTCASTNATCTPPKSTPSSATPPRRRQAGLEGYRRHRRTRPHHGRRRYRRALSGQQANAGELLILQVACPTDSHAPAPSMTSLGDSPSAAELGYHSRAGGRAQPIRVRFGQIRSAPRVLPQPDPGKVRAGRLRSAGPA